MPDQPIPPSPPPLPVGDISPQSAARRRDLRLGGRTLREHAARGSLINGAFLSGVGLLALGKGFLLAGFLSREDYGIWGVLAVTFWSLLWLKQVGIGDKYIQQDEDDQELAFQKAFTLEAILNLAFLVLLAAALPVMALVYGERDLILPGLVLLAILPAGALQWPVVAYHRRMQFVRQRSLMAFEPVVAFVVSVGLAIAGAGYWALVLGALAGAWAAAAAAVVVSPYPMRLRYERGTMRSYAVFSGPLFLATLGSLLIAQGGILTSEAYLGLAGVGAVTLAATISQFTDRVDGAVTGSLYPAICAVRDRVDLLHESFVKSNRLALMWAMPFGLGLTLFADDLVSFGIGEEWRPAVVLLQAYGVTAAIAHVGFNWDAYHRAIGKTWPMAVASGAAAVVFLASVLPLLDAYGLKGFAIAVGLQALAHVIVRAYYLRRLFHGFGFVLHALRAMAPTVPAVLAVVAARALEAGERTLLMAFGELSLFLAVATAATVALEGPLLREAMAYLRARPSASAPV